MKEMVLPTELSLKMKMKKGKILQNYKRGNLIKRLSKFGLEWLKHRITSENIPEIPRVFV